MSKKTGKKVEITDVRLLLLTPIDLRGIPTANEDKTLAVWLKPKIFQMDNSEDIVNILFLDEISAAPQSVQAAAYQITLDRTVGAVAGGLAGILYGYDSIPKEWISTIVKSDIIYKLCKKFVEGLVDKY